MQSAILTILAFIGMEIFSYLAHRYLFHGILWKIHQTHHQANKFFLELNDVFSLIFALVSVGLMFSGNAVAFPVGLGIAIYGFVYLITHDFFTHRRFLPFKSTNKILLTIRAAHQRHHQTMEKIGIEPFGLFVFDYAKFGEKINRETTRSKPQITSVQDKKN
ncbi:MAG: sterol desaturase family protein [Pyrinomonadaceae bacterium]|nr:sterol desaturase family protein [Pyrinomonadaceae bacterium]